MTRQTKTVLLSADCIPVKGLRRSFIYDLGRNSVVVIPNSLFEILIEYNGFPYRKLLREYSDQAQIVQDYYKLLLDNECLIRTNQDKCFTSLSNTFKSPLYINNIIIDVDRSSVHDFHKKIGRAHV